MASSEKKRLKEWEKFAKETDKLFSNIEKDRARKFKGLPDRLVNVLFTVIASAAVIFFTYFDVAFINISEFSNSLFTGEGFSSSAGSWGIIAGVLGLSSGVSMNKVRMPKFLKKVTSRPGLIASVAVLIALPGAVESEAITYTNMLLIAFGFIFYSCLSSRSNMYNLSLVKTEKKAANKLENVKKLISAQLSGQTSKDNPTGDFMKIAKKLSGSKKSANRTSNLFLVLMAMVITLVWAYLIKTMDVTLVSSVAVIALITVLEVVEAFKGPNAKNTAIDEKISTESVSSIFSQIQQLMVPQA